MSNLEPHPQEDDAGGTVDVAPAPAYEVLIGREVVLGGTRAMTVTRTLPHKHRRMVGAWCFVDHYGPDDIGQTSGMLVAPHPHTGLQTVTWLVEGEVHHLDSLGSSQQIRPGQLNLMTAGVGIAHAELSPRDHSSRLHGTQLWVALPERYAGIAPSFEHHADLPVLDEPGVTTTVVMGTHGGLTSPATTYSPLVGAEITLAAGASAQVPLTPAFEHAVLVMSGDVAMDDQAIVGPGTLVYLGTNRDSVVITGEQPARVFLLGGEPFDEEIVMWWNFVGRSHAEIVRAREEWMAGLTEPGRFGVVSAYDGKPLPAPELPATTLKPRGRTR